MGFRNKATELTRMATKVEEIPANSVQYIVAINKINQVLICKEIKVTSIEKNICMGSCFNQREDIKR